MKTPWKHASHYRSRVLDQHAARFLPICSALSYFVPLCKTRNDRPICYQKTRFVNAVTGCMVIGLHVACSNLLLNEEKQIK